MMTQPTVSQSTASQSTITQATISQTTIERSMATQSEAQPRIIREWLNRADGERSERDIIQFYSYLERAHHDLLTFAATANRRQILKDMLQHFIDR